jgi:hypothetical protein
VKVEGGSIESQGVLSTKMVRERDDIFNKKIVKFYGGMATTCNELSFPANVSGKPRKAANANGMLIFDGREFDEECPSLPDEQALMISKVLTHAAFSAWICDPVSFWGKPQLLLAASIHWLHDHLEGGFLPPSHLSNVYHYFRSDRALTVYNRYKYVYIIYHVIT